MMYIIQASLTIIFYHHHYDCNMFIVQATDYYDTEFVTAVKAFTVQASKVLNCEYFICILTGNIVNLHDLVSGMTTTRRL
jgi:hypothetical protein